MPRIKDFSKGRSAAAQVTEPEDDEAAKLAAEQQEPEQHDSGNENDPSIAFQKQIDALRKSEQAQREQNEILSRDRDEAIRRANERDAENESLKKTTYESQGESIASSMAAANAAAQAAQNDLERAFELGILKVRLMPPTGFPRQTPILPALKTARWLWNYRPSKPQKSNRQRPMIH